MLGSFLSVPAKGWPGAGHSRFNIAHPKTQAFFADVVDRLLAEGVKHPSGRDALRHFTVTLRFLDLDNMTKGGFLIGTYGMEEHLVPFAEYFRAMPAVPFETLSDERGVVIRRAVRDGVTYLYVANTTDVERKVSVPFVPGMRDVVTGETFDGPKNLVLPRWQLRSFRTK